MNRFQSAMRIFGGFNIEISATQVRSCAVSIRHADFRWFQLLPCAFNSGPMGVSIRHADFRWFQLRSQPAKPARWTGFNPPCGFSVVSTSRSRNSDTIRCWFQSAMRIFGGFNFERTSLRFFNCIVSIRHADFRWFQRADAWREMEREAGFNPPCGFSVVSTAMRLGQTYRKLSSFNPPCGFSVVSTHISHTAPLDTHEVSIRHADFRWFQRGL